MAGARRPEPAEQRAEALHVRGRGAVDPDAVEDRLEAVDELAGGLGQQAQHADDEVFIVAVADEHVVQVGSLTAGVGTAAAALGSCCHRRRWWRRRHHNVQDVDQGAGRRERLLPAQGTLAGEDGRLDGAHGAEDMPRGPRGVRVVRGLCRTAVRAAAGRAGGSACGGPIMVLLLVVVVVTMQEAEDVVRALGQLPEGIADGV